MVEILGKGSRVFYLEPMIWRSYNSPEGFLHPHKACHALWYYAMCARSNYEKQQSDLIYEGDPDPIYDFRSLMMGIATLYGVQPEEMIRFWNNVDLQMVKMKIPLVPLALRQATVASIRTH